MTYIYTSSLPFPWNAVASQLPAIPIRDRFCNYHLSFFSSCKHCKKVDGKYVALSFCKQNDGRMAMPFFRLYIKFLEIPKNILSRRFFGGV